MASSKGSLSGKVKSEKSIKVNGFDDTPRPFLIGVGGGTASGKSTVCKKIMEQLGELEIDEKQRHVIIVSIESFYRPLTQPEQTLAKKGQFNFDHPSTFDEDLMLSTLQAIRRRETVQVPKYDFVNCCRKEDEWLTVYPADVILFEGILVFYFKEIRDMFHMKLFVDTDADTRLSRRVVRDLKEMGRDLEHILYQYTAFVKPAFEEFCLPTKKYADIIIPRGADNTVAIELIVQQIRELMKPSRDGSAVRRVRHNSDSLLVFNYDPCVSPKYRSARPH